MEEELKSKTNRLGACEVCGEVDAKYTCPACEVKTCSLPCSKIHKKELNCTGKRNKVMYKHIKSLGDMDLHSDYSLLEQAARDLEAMSKKIKETRHISRSEKDRCNRLIESASLRKIRLQLLPKQFTKHKRNQTYLNWKKDELFWTIEWIFPEAENFTCHDRRVLDTTKLSEAVSKYTDKDKASKEVQKKLSVYQEPGQEVKVLLSAEKLPGNRFFLLNPKKTLCENLMHKIIVEYPVFYVILAQNMSQYNFVHLVSKNKPNKNLLMATEEEMDNL